MPFLRVIRDKRGYETTYLMHWYREGSRQRSKVLYVFRTPGGVRVGRHPFDADILREIESQHPDIDFDWDVVRENQQIIEPATEVRRRRPKREGGEAAPQPAPPQPAAAAPVQPPPPSRPPIPSAIEGSTPDEQMTFLATLYPVVLERIALRTSDPERRQALEALAARLNPAAWTDADQITTGLQHAAEALERLSHVLAKRRRRSRKSRGQRDRAAGDATVDSTPAPDATDAAASADASDVTDVDDSPDPPDTDHE